MNQLSLFKTDRTDIEPRPVNREFIRKNLMRLLRTAQRAEIMPWSPAEAQSWERRFPELTALLEPDEGSRILADFQVEMERLKAAEAHAGQPGG